MLSWFIKEKVFPSKRFTLYNSNLKSHIKGRAGHISGKIDRPNQKKKSYWAIGLLGKLSNNGLMLFDYWVIDSYLGLSKFY